MKVTGIIAEYNPFHNGHLYHIEQTRRMTDADYIICVMSGDFVQRGTPAVMDKYKRTAFALKSGVDLVLELPVCYSTASAEYFAYGSTYILDTLGVTDAISFGSERGAIAPLSQIARLFCAEPPAFSRHLSMLLRAGFSFPRARQESCLHYFNSINVADSSKLSADDLRQILSAPNNILAIEYLKALMKLESNITPVTVERMYAGHHTAELNGEVSSASAVRGAIIHQSNDAVRTGSVSPIHESVLHSMPLHTHQTMLTDFQKTYPMTEDDFSMLLSYKLLSETDESLSAYFDCHPDIAKRIIKYGCSGLTYSQLAHAVKSKNMTFSRVSHVLCHILLNIRQEQMKQFLHPQYVRVLGMQKKAAPLLRAIRSKCGLPIIQQLSSDSRLLDENAHSMLSMDIHAHQLYSLVQHEKFGLPIQSEYTKNAIIMDII